MKTISTRTILFCCVVLLMQLHASAQNDSVQLHYLQKSKNQKTTACVMLGVGTGLLITGLVAGSKPLSYDAFARVWGTVYIGLAAVLISVPFFINSHNYKKRAALSVSSSYSSRLQMNGISRVPQPCLKLAIPLR